jgi:hypothetical protein
VVAANEASQSLALAMSSYHGQTLLKPRSTKVNPILRKLTQSEKNSLDLDRPAAEQDGVGLYDYGGGRPSHDAAFGQAGRRGYHIRSTSGTSQFSTATSTSGTRTGSFVHPFQQTPRPYTPPQLASSYQNSLRESDDSNSPEPTEDEEQQQNYSSRRISNPSTATPSLLTAATAPPARTGLQPNLRIQTNKQSSRVPLSTSHTSHQTHLSPLSPVEITSSIETMTPSTTLRSSFDTNFRLRSRSEVDPRDRATLVQDARRKFTEKEKAKEEKAAREEIRQREKRDQKEAQKIERSHRQSSASDATRSKRSKSDLTMQSEKQGGGNEGLFAHQPDATGEGEAFPTDEQQQRSYSATNNAKKKTHSAWTKLMMWIRTRFIRMKGKKRRPPPGPLHAYGATRH